MRRAYLMVALAGLAAAGMGCKHVAGKCDCTHDPADAVIPAPNNPYFPTASTVSTPIPAPVPAMMPAPIPPVTAPSAISLPMVPALPAE